MFEMFKGMGQIASMLKNLPKMREDMEQMQQRIASLTADGDAGAGMVKAKVNGRFEMVGLQISEEAMKLNDREMLEDLIKAAFNQAVAKIREEAAGETAKAMSGMGLPPGMNLPGMS
jgi:hypothetical protein